MSCCQNDPGVEEVSEAEVNIDSDDLDNSIELSRVMDDIAEEFFLTPLITFLTLLRILTVYLTIFM